MAYDPTECGAIYGVSRLPWLRETIVSAASLKQRMPELPLELHIDQHTYNLLPSDVSLDDFFDLIHVYDDHKHWRSSKFSALTSDRFEKTMVIDGDTFINDRLDELFELLDRFDIAAMHAPQRIHSRTISSGLLDILPVTPISFPEYNTGVLMFRRSPEVSEFLRYWQELYELGMKEKGYMMDQATFRIALYHSELRIATLTPEYNFRAGVPNIVKGEVKIIHAHGHLKEIAQLANESSEKIRVVLPQREKLYGFYPKGIDRTEPNNEDTKTLLEEISATVKVLKS